MIFPRTIELDKNMVDGMLKNLSSIREAGLSLNHQTQRSGSISTFWTCSRIRATVGVNGANGGDSSDGCR